MLHPFMKTIRNLSVVVLFSLSVQAQVVNTATLDTVGGEQIGKIRIGGYLDTYFGYNFNNAPDNAVPYMVSMHRHNEITVNLAYIDLRYNAERLRARIVPAMGTYMNANYAAETGVFKNMLEASAGIKLHPDKEIWLDAGVLGSPYTNESAISREHLMYTRSFSAEYAPYYLSGAKLSVPLGKKVTLYTYLINGWQQIQDVNDQKSIGTQIEYRPDNKNLINWNTYAGSERSTLRTDFRMRYFTDVYWIHNPEGRFSSTACVYAGMQERINLKQQKVSYFWGQANYIARLRIKPNKWISGRMEYFTDPENVMLRSINGQNKYSAASGSLCYTVKLFNQAMLRAEARHFYSENTVFRNAANLPVNQSTWFIGNMTVWF